MKNTEVWNDGNSRGDAIHRIAYFFIKNFEAGWNYLLSIIYIGWNARSFDWIAFFVGLFTVF